MSDFSAVLAELRRWVEQAEESLPPLLRPWDRVQFARQVFWRAATLLEVREGAIRGALPGFDPSREIRRPWRWQPAPYQPGRCLAPTEEYLRDQCAAFEVHLRRDLAEARRECEALGLTPRKGIRGDLALRHLVTVRRVLLREKVFQIATSVAAWEFSRVDPEAVYLLANRIKTSIRRVSSQVRLYEEVPKPAEILPIRVPRRGLPRAA